MPSLFQRTCSVIMFQLLKKIRRCHLLKPAIHPVKVRKANFSRNLETISFGSCLNIPSSTKLVISGRKVSNIRYTRYLYLRNSHRSSRISSKRKRIQYLPLLNQLTHSPNDPPSNLAEPSEYVHTQIESTKYASSPHQTKKAALLHRNPFPSLPLQYSS